jgi:drug/metabolite transporter (DMT)-like permease
MNLKIKKYIKNLWKNIIKKSSMFLKTFIQPFLFSEDRFSPPYFWISLFLYYAIKLLNIRTDPIKSKQIPVSDGLILGVLGFVFTWLSVYSTYKYLKNKNKNKNK